MRVQVANFRIIEVHTAQISKNGSELEFLVIKDSEFCAEPVYLIVSYENKDTAHLIRLMHDIAVTGFIDVSDRPVRFETRDNIDYGRVSYDECNKKLRHYSVEEFIEATASSFPTPGGGSVSALIGSLSAALSEMVINLTINNDKYSDVQSDMAKLLHKISSIRQDLKMNMQDDADSFELYMRALNMPKNTESEKSDRKNAINRALKITTNVSLQTANLASKIFPIAKKVIETGNKNAITDAILSILLAKTAIYGALLNVEINIKSIKDSDFNDIMVYEMAKLKEEATRYEEYALSVTI